MEDQRLLASVALFRKLYDNKKDSYDVLAEFLRAAININDLWIFTVEECSYALKIAFGFDIPSAVIKSCLQKRLKGEVVLSYGNFTTTEKFKKSKSLQEEINSAQTEQSRIIQQLIEFVENEKNKELTTDGKDRLQDDFHQFFLGGLRSGENHIHISQFILKNSKDKEFTDRLNHLEEGLILYQGIGYSPILSPNHSHQYDITIYLDTEILFWANGYDGKLFKSIFSDFISLANEINSKKNSTSQISIKYFPEVKQEIDAFFAAAEHIISGDRTADPSGAAMQHLLDGCKSPSDIVTKKSVFYTNLAKLRITEEKAYDYYSPPTFNCESNDLLDQLIGEFADYSPEKIHTVLKHFTKINYFRKGISKTGLEQSKAILLSGKKISKLLAFHPSILQEEGAIPFATGIEYLTERFWLKLGKGFSGDKVSLTAFDVVARAQVILSTQIGNKVSSDFKELTQRIASGELTTNDASYIVSDLKMRPIKPEDIDADNYMKMSEFLSVDTIEAVMREKKIHEQNSIDLALTIKTLEETTENASKIKHAIYIQKLSEWKAGIDRLKNKARRYYKIILSIVLSSPFIVAILLALYLKSNSDTSLSQVGFVATVGALLWPFISINGCKKFTLRRTKEKLRKDIKKHGTKPTMKSVLDSLEFNS